MNLTAVLTTPLWPPCIAGSFFTGLYIDASRGTGRVIIPSLAVLAAERQVAGAGKHAASLRFAENVCFTAALCCGCDGLEKRGLAGGPRCCDRLARGEGGRAAHGPVAGTRAVRGYRHHSAEPHLTRA